MRLTLARVVFVLVYVVFLMTLFRLLMVVHDLIKRLLRYILTRLCLFLLFKRGNHWQGFTRLINQCVEIIIIYLFSCLNYFWNVELIIIYYLLIIESLILFNQDFLRWIINFFLRWLHARVKSLIACMILFFINFW